jgi:hypothetical protein
VRSFSLVARGIMMNGSKNRLMPRQQQEQGLP